MGLPVYKKSFPVDRDFNLTKFIQALDEKDFAPFVLHIEKLSESKYKLSFQRIKMPLFISSSQKGNIADEILLADSTLELLQTIGEIRFSASIRNSTLIVMGLFLVFFISIPILMHSLLSWIPLLIFVLSQFLKYYWDTRRYHAIGEMATNSNFLSNNNK